MKPIIENKIQQVEAIVSQLKEAKSFIIFEYLGLTGKKVAELRRNLHNINAKMYVAKNNIFARALKECGHGDEMGEIAGPCALIIAKGDEIVPFKEINTLMKDFKFIHYKNGYLEGSVVGIDKLSTIASLPTRDGLLSMLCSVLQGSIRNLMYGLKAVSNTKE
ncbi:MAG: 50S ribosomal protein L10 [Mycoplasmataceae bacterium]|jgi:large subunit ribosomal protein L10|nr:50S ribosomal protein L10 [Mycoplasmataceae bacterium]